jgi:hypothetical protein
MTKEEYAKLYGKYFRMDTKTLEKNIGQLYNKKFIDNDISVYEEHRVAARVLLERSRDGTGLIYHLKNIVVKSC